MVLKDLVTRCRSYRRFHQEISIPLEELRDMTDTARLASCASNAQALKYAIVHTPEECAHVFPLVHWAAALKDWPGPQEGERPSAYIIIVCDQSIAKNRQWDEGIAAQTIMLSAVEKGYGGCIMASFDRKALTQVLGLDPERFSPELVLALGKPSEQVVLVSLGPEGSTTYYRDENQVHYVPKRSLDDILLN